MALQAKSLAISAGANGKDVNYVADQLKQRKNMDFATATEILRQLQ
jgi:hydroxymethylglutaryl-CoA reductase